MIDSIYLINLLLVLTVMAGVWIVSLIKRDVSIVDPCWGVGIVVIAVSTFLQASNRSVRGDLLLVLTTLWGLRLSGYLLWRNWGIGEDRRYRAMREKHGQRFGWVSLWTVFVLQAVLLWFISLPVQVGIFTHSLNPLGPIDYLGCSLWLLGLSFETIGDWQLARFTSYPENRGRVLDRGLWHYTRHPNYFGDFCVWWGLYIIALSSGGVWTLLSPVLMSFLLLRVSGVSLLEEDIVDRRPEYRRYQQTTNAFFPGFPRRELEEEA